MRSFFILSLFLISFRLSGQVDIEKTIPIKAEQIYNDPFDNLYCINGNELVKVNPQGELMFSFQYEKGNRITGGDFKNPLKILLFLDNRHQILILDRYLTKIDEFDLWDKTDSFHDLIVICSETGGYYLYDSFTSRLTKFDHTFQSQYILQVPPDNIVKSLFEFHAKLYFQFESGELSGFDFENGELFMIPAKNFNHPIHISGNYLTMYNPEKHCLKLYDSDFIFQFCINLPADLPIIDALFLNNKIIFIDGAHLYISNVLRD